MSAIRTRTLHDRRSLRFARMRDILHDVEQLDRAGASNVQALGNWTAAQVVLHVTMFIEWSLDGFPFAAPWWLRRIGLLIKGRALNKPLKPGIRLLKSMSAALPPTDATWDDAVGRLRHSMSRIERGERMSQPSPVFGRLEHEEWIQLHCRHAEMHLSLLHAVAEQAGDDSRG